MSGARFTPVARFTPDQLVELARDQLELAMSTSIDRDPGGVGAVALTSLAASALVHGLVLNAITNTLERIAAVNELQCSLAASHLPSIAELEAWIEETPDEEKHCTRCGCTVAHACVGGCAWIAPGLCSRCDRRGRREPQLVEEPHPARRAIELTRQLHDQPE